MKRHKTGREGASYLIHFTYKKRIPGGRRRRFSWQSMVEVCEGGTDAALRLFNADAALRGYQDVHVDAVEYHRPHRREQTLQGTLFA